MFDLPYFGYSSNALIENKIFLFRMEYIHESLQKRAEDCKQKNGNTVLTARKAKKRGALKSAPQGQHK
jgi:hypothetical protein